MSHVTAFRFTLAPTPAQEALLRTAGGAARLTYNTLLALVKERLDEHHEDPDVRVPWSAFDLINAANHWKRTALVQAIDPATGQPWHRMIPALVLEEAAVDLAHALAAFTASRAGRRGGSRVCFPRFKKKHATPYSFRVRNRNGCVVVGVPGHPRSLRLPKLGVFSVREDTRKLRRMLRPGPAEAARARICAVTVRRRRDRWVAVVTVRAADLHPSVRHPETTEGPAGWTGVDMGLVDLVVAADEHGVEQTRAPVQRARPDPGSRPERRRQPRLLWARPRTSGPRPQPRPRTRKQQAGITTPDRGPGHVTGTAP
ncbi:helix-turn-helix domain-containing protein [Actinomadura hibisca]|uniref:helix-turn-helix domain-containing protein n=1 Tax=Actinomadura hibisca TaxID=68565 RepID=UPI0008298ABD|nr:helix-turn-helix domain-containing protein [Actinomadura hibisca]